MHRNLLLLLIMSAALSRFAFAHGDLGYGLGYDPYRYYGGAARFDNDIELSRIRRQLNQQRRSDQAQQRRSEEEINLLRQRNQNIQQLSANQACYYRSTGGFELCADLFAAESTEFTDCEARVVARNPGCNGNLLNGSGTPLR